MTDPSWPLQQALYSALEAALSCPVYDAVPQGAAYPYVVLGDEVRRNADPVSGRRRDIRYRYLSIWSQHKGQREVMQIIAAIDAALHEQPLTLSTGDVVSVRVDNSSTSRDADGETYMGRVTLKILTQR